MSRFLFIGVFLLGTIAILWIGRIFLGADTLGLAVTLLIGLVYVIGTLELLIFRRATQTLQNALTTLNHPIDSLSSWLANIDPSLQNAVRMRVSGERVPLPAPVITPYLVGLLVMLGLLGTFVGMVDTLKGAVSALEGSSELEAIRAGLAAPIEGLGLAFGTSVAGVAASAMLGLLSVIGRRERLQTSNLLDAKIGADDSELSAFSLNYQQKMAFDAIQRQAEALPEVANLLTDLVQSIEHKNEALGHRLIDTQLQFHDKITVLYGDLATSVDKSLKTTLSSSATLMGDHFQPLAEQTLTQISESASRTQAQLADAADRQLSAMNDNADNHGELMRKAMDAVVTTQQSNGENLLATVSESMQRASEGLEANASALTAGFEQVSAQWTQQQQEQTATFNKASDRQLTAMNDTAGKHSQLMREAVEAVVTTQQSSGERLLATVSESMQRASQNLEVNASVLTAGFEQASVQWAKQQHDQAESLTAGISQQLAQLRDEEAERGDAAVARLGQLQTSVAVQLADLGRALEDPMLRLIETASETPKAAAEVIQTLRAEISKNVSRENELLSERAQLMAQLDGLAEALQASSQAQREAIDGLITRSNDTLLKVADQFSEHVSGESGKLADITQQFANSSIEMASLGEAFSAAVGVFGESNTELLENLSRIEVALEKSSSRSDEQLAYYVAQAREIIDHTVLSHQQIIAALKTKQPEQLVVAEANG